MITEVNSLQELSERLTKLQQSGVKITFPKQPGCCETMPSAFQWQDEAGNWLEVRLRPDIK